MAQDANGSPTTNFAFPTQNTASDPPSGKGINSIIADVDTKLNSRFVHSTDTKDTNDVPVWNGSAWVYQKVNVNNIEPGSNGQVLTTSGGVVGWAAATGDNGGKELLYHGFGTADSATVGATSGAINDVTANRDQYFTDTAGVAFDGSTTVLVEVYAAYMYVDQNLGFRMFLEEVVGGTPTIIAKLAYHGAGTQNTREVILKYRYTPTSGTKAFRISGLATGASGNTVIHGSTVAGLPSFLRITQVS